MFPYLIEENKRTPKPSSPSSLGRNSEEVNHRMGGSHVQNNVSPILQSELYDKPFVDLTDNVALSQNHLYSL